MNAQSLIFLIRIKWKEKIKNNKKYRNFAVKYCTVTRIKNTDKK